MFLSQRPFRQYVGQRSCGKIPVIKKVRVNAPEFLNKTSPRVSMHALGGLTFDSLQLSTAITGATIVVAGDARRGPILTDTRDPAIPLGSTWFLALKGSLHDGHDFVADCINEVVCGVIVSNLWLKTNSSSNEMILEAKSKGVGVVAVSDTEDALSHLCEYAMRCYKHIPVVALTGSCGKSTCKSMVRLRSSTFLFFVS